MNPKLTLLAAGTGGVFSRQEALSCGYTARQIRIRLGDGRWRRVRHGYYAESRDMSHLPDWERARLEHHMRCHAAMKARSGGAVLSHQSALVVHDLPVWGASIAEVHLTAYARRSGREVAGVRLHRGTLSRPDVVEVDGLTVTAPARAMFEFACTESFESAVVAADAVLNRGLVSRDEAVRLRNLTMAWPGGASARAAIGFANARSESVGESRLRVLVDRTGLPEPQLQAVFRDAAGFVGRVDLYFPGHATVVEFDGRVKYGEGVETLVREKRREDRLRALGLQVVRVTWAELDGPDAVAERIRQGFGRAAQ